MQETRVRLHSLDALRGLAALSVVLWHWQHFQLLGTRRFTWSNAAPALNHSHQPFALVLSVFYAHGFIAVDLFFLISGFIFFWLYKNRVADGSLSVIDFWVLRITRLYPLHVGTLLLVAGLQAMFHRQTGQYFVYGANDPIHFVKSLLFFQLNGDGAAFNGPTWSVTVELVMYVLFCITARMGLLRHAIVPALLFFGGLFLYQKHQNIAMGICGFFEGGLLYLAFENIIMSIYKKKLFYAVSMLCGLLWFYIVIDYCFPLISPGVTIFLHGAALRLCVVYIVFPLTILFFALHETMTEFRYHYFSWLGEISYSGYLLHFPLQLFFALAVVVGFLPKSIGNSPLFILVYGGILILLSLVVFRGFELPVQRMLRRKWRILSSSRRLWWNQHA